MVVDGWIFKILGEECAAGVPGQLRFAFHDKEKKTHERVFMTRKRPSTKPDPPPPPAHRSALYIGTAANAPTPVSC